MKRVILTVVAVVFCLLSSRALTLWEYQQQDGRPCAYKITYIEDFNRISPNEYFKPWHLPEDKWAIPANGKEFVVDDYSMNGLIANSFEDFYYNEEIGKISPLKRESAAYLEQYTAKKDTMNMLRDNLTQQFLLIPIWKYLWSNGYQYDLDDSSFTFELPSTSLFIDYAEEEFNALSDQEKIDNYTYKNIVAVPESMYGCFLKGRVRTGYDLKTNEPIYTEVYTNRIRVPIANKTAALAIEENKQDISKDTRWPLGREFDFYLKARLVDKENLSHLELEDIILLHHPTKEVVWSAKDGDFSNEMTAFQVKNVL